MGRLERCFSQTTTLENCELEYFLLFCFLEFGVSSTHASIHAMKLIVLLDLYWLLHYPHHALQLLKQLVKNTVILLKIC